jgi:hypothetical protein
MTRTWDEVLEKAFSIRKLDLPYVPKLRNNGRERDAKGEEEKFEEKRVVAFLVGSVSL